MNISYEIKENAGVINLEGKLTAENAEQVKNSFISWYNQQEVNNIVIDMSQLDFMDSTGLGILVSFLKLVHDRHGELRLATLQAKPKMVIEITRTYRILNLFDTLEEALKF